MAIILVDIAPHHIADKQVARYFSHPSCRDMLAVSKNRNPVRDFEYFLQPVADEEHCDTPVSKLAGRSKKLLDLVARKRRGGLVHNQNLDIERNCLRDFNCLLRGQGKPLRSRPNVELHTQIGQYPFGLVVHVLPAHELPLIAMSDENVFRHIQIREYQRLLIDRGYPACLRVLRVRQAGD